MNYLRKYRNRFVTKIELVSALDDSVFLISPPDGFTGDPVPVQYNGVYFTLSSAELTQKSKSTSAGTTYTVALDFSFPVFVGIDDFEIRFAKLSEIRVTFNSKGVIRLNTNDVSLNSPMDVEFSRDIKTCKFSTQLIRIFPLPIDEQ